MPRVSLTGAYDNRAGVSGTVNVSAGIIGIGVVGIFVIGRSSTLAVEEDRRFMNCYVTVIKDEALRTAKPYVIKRPGFGVSHIPAPGNIGTALHIWIGQGSGGKVMTAFGGTNSTIYDVTTPVGTINGRATAITETTISSIPTLTITSTDSSGWYYQDGGTLTKITNANFPGNAGVMLAGTFVHIGGIAYIMGQDGYIYNSDVNSIINWTGSNKYATNSYPDKGIGCVRRGEYIVAFGTQSMEVLKNGNVPPPGSPLMRIPDSTQQVGAISSQAMLNVRDVIYWAGATPQGAISIYRWAGGSAEAVSNAAINAQLVIAGPSNITMTSASFYGNTHIFVQVGSITYAYCVDENCWWEVSSRMTFRLRMDSLTIGPNIVTYAISSTMSGGKVYTMNPAQAVYNDDGFAYTSMVQTAALDFGTSKRKAFYQLELVADVEKTPSPVSIVWSDDDFQTFNDDARQIDLSSTYRSITRLGSSRRRVFRLVHNANTPFRMEALDINVQTLTT